MNVIVCFITHANGTVVTVGISPASRVRFLSMQYTDVPIPFIYATTLHSGLFGIPVTYLYMPGGLLGR